MVGMSYFSDRQGGAKPRTVEDVSEGVATAVIGMIKTRIADCSFARAYPSTCFEYDAAVVATDETALRAAVQGFFPDLSWPLAAGELVGNHRALDLVEFTFEKTAEARARGDNASHAAYASHQHLTFDVGRGRDLFREEVNRLFEANGLVYALEENGQVVRLAPSGITDAPAAAVFHTGDETLDGFLEQARAKYLNHEQAVRYEGLERLWDAFERLKTVETGADKRAQAEALLTEAAPKPEIRERLRTEMSELTSIGNKFLIRHTETDKVPIESDEDLDYFFGRMFMLIRRLLRGTGRGG
jgi:hypothetical protein